MLVGFTGEVIHDEILNSVRLTYRKWG